MISKILQKSFKDIFNWLLIIVVIHISWNTALIYKIGGLPFIFKVLILSILSIISLLIFSIIVRVGIYLIKLAFKKN